MEAAALEAIVVAARAAWPGVEVDREAFATFVAERQADVHGTDLWLACACLAGSPAAIAAFDRAFTPVIDRAVSASGATPTEVADLRQVVRERLLVAARLASYSGRAALASWVRVVATREAARMLAKERREVAADDDDLGRLVLPDDDPEVGYLKRLYRAEFRAAFEAAVDALEDRERMILAQHLLDRVSIDALGTQHGVHRSTAARWIEAARAAVLAGTRRELLAKLKVSSQELESIMRLIGSQLDVSLPAALRPR